MALPASHRTSVIPQELELVACEQLVEIVPLVAMERTAFISVRTFELRDHYDLVNLSHFREHMGHCVHPLNAESPYGWL